MNAALEHLAERISQKTATIGVVGLGYVGLPVACVFADAGYEVIGIDVQATRVSAVNGGLSPMAADEPGLSKLLAEVVANGRLTASSDASRLRDADVITINVQTPVTADNCPDYSALESAAQAVGDNLTPETLVVVESTVSPGTTEGLVGPTVAAASKLELNREWFLGACPERVMPGRLLENIRRVPRICGGSTPQVASTMRKLYSTVVDADIDEGRIPTAELVKVVENTYRDVQIAFANEVALICADLGEDVWRVREMVNKVPERNMHRPGGGVGGHCIPKDPWLLASASDRQLRLIPAARSVNTEMPRVIAEMVRDAAEALLRTGVAPDRANTVLILGYSYLADSDDLRNSPSIALEKILLSEGMNVLVHDAVVPEMDIDLEAASSRSGIAITMVGHTAYEGMAPFVPFHLDARHLDRARADLDELKAADHA